MPAVSLAQPTANSQPPTSLKGHINTFYRHYNGRKLGPYYVRRWKVGRKVFRQYIKPADVERVRAACAAYREGQKRINKIWLHCANLDYMQKMVKWACQGKLRPVDIDYINRIKSEGWAINGRPATRRKVSRELITLDGKQVVKKTVYEVDGTTTVFMVPFFINECACSIVEPRKVAIERLIDRLMDAFFDVNGHSKPLTDH